MVASPRQRLILPLAPLGAGVIGSVTALLFLVTPSGALESLIVDSGIASVVNAAQPPLHFTARAVLALGGGGLLALLAWVALFVAVGTRSVMLQTPQRAGDDAAPALRRADAHPDAPPRRPVFANRDLGTPFLEIRAEAPVPVEAAAAIAPPAPLDPAAERALPMDLDMPLAAFDPTAVPAEPFAWTAPARKERPDVMPIVRDALPEVPAPRPLPTPANLAPIAEAMSLIERAAPATTPFRLHAMPTVDLVPPAPPVQRAEPYAGDSIRALLDRLERSVAEREAAKPAPQPRRETIRETLDTLRTLATRTG